ncbi:MAG: M1 family metallopeptidase [Acidimicrobiales bacterium]
MALFDEGSDLPLSAYRLPGAARPTRYELVIAPDLEAFTFSGEAVIELEAAQQCAELVLNAAELEIDAAAVETAAGRVEAEVALDPAAERATITPARPVEAGPATLHLRFRGVLNDKLHGFYRSSFTDRDGRARTIAVTQFEATDARRAFPCWDEPEHKAVFAITLVVEDGLFALSNAAQVSDEPTGDGRRRVRFADTMPMSTYLVAMVVGPLEATDPVDVDGTPLRVVHPVGAGELAAYALEVGAFSLRYFADYYGIAYPGDKLDLVAVPDFAFGAMENLGCVTFREVLLLVDPTQTTQPELQRVADVIAHELAHMWFGDLVTMKWWNGIWLNEAFATFMEMKAVDAFRPDWRRWVDFGLSRSSAFDVDSLASTRPVEYPVHSPTDAEGMFDVLTYEKGAALVRMLEMYLGEDAFRAGIARYLRQHSYANTETTDLWDAIETASGQPVRQIMDSWIFQGGYPLISVELAADGRALRLRQDRFRYAGGPAPDPAEAPRWKAPLLVRVGDADGARRDLRLLLEEEGATVPLDAPAAWALVNAGGHGFYRVRYDDALLGAVAARAQDELTPIERYNLIDDAFAAVLAGRSSAAGFLSLAQGFAAEDDLSVWQRILGALAALSRVLEGPALAAYEATVRELVGGALDIVGWAPAEGEGERTRELRGALFHGLGAIGGDERAHQRAAELHAAHLADPASVDPPLVAAAVKLLAQRGGRAEFDLFVERWKAAPTPQEEQRYLYALAEFEADGLVDEALARCLTGEIRTQNSPYLIRLALANRAQGPHVWDWLKANWQAVNDKLPSNTLARMLEGIRALAQPAVAADVHAFFAAHPMSHGAKTVAQHLERLDVNVALAEREAGPLAAALAARRR